MPPLLFAVHPFIGYAELQHREQHDADREQEGGSRSDPVQPAVDPVIPDKVDDGLRAGIPLCKDLRIHIRLQVPDKARTQQVEQRGRDQRQRDPEKLAQLSRAVKFRRLIIVARNVRQPRQAEDHRAADRAPDGLDDDGDLQPERVRHPLNIRTEDLIDDAHRRCTAR